MRFIDLFAGLGGFHIAMKRLGHRCVFASELDIDLQNLYKYNFNFIPSGDITKIQTIDIPQHDILCAGFPCQPFSKAGERKETADERGKLLYIVEDILKYHKPSYFILENVTRFKGSDLDIHFRKEMNNLYNIQEKIYSPEDFGINQHRPRVFIIGQLNSLKEIKDLDLFHPRKKTPKQYKIKDIKLIETEKSEILELWQNIINELPFSDTDEIYSPLWSTEFKATYPFEKQSTINYSVNELSEYKGKYGVSLEYISKEEQIENLPKYARTDVDMFPDWKIRFIKNSREYCNKNHKIFEKYLPQLKKLSLSHQKLEWNVKGKSRNLKDHIIQFRPSGIRVSNKKRFPSLVSINLTQIPIMSDNYGDFRYISQEEALSLQSFPIKFNLPKEHSKAFKALGNTINTEIVYQLVKFIIKS